MIRELVKIANKLDSLGLTKEADVLDAYAVKLAYDDGSMLNMTSPEVQLHPDSVMDPAVKAAIDDLIEMDVLHKGDAVSTITEFIEWANKKNPKQPLVAGDKGTYNMYNYYLQAFKAAPVEAPPVAKKPVPHSWGEYANIVGGADSASVRQAWETYARDSASDASFEAFVGWWKSMKKSGQFRKGGSVSEVCDILTSKRVSAATPVAGGAQATSAPVIPQGVRSGGEPWANRPGYIGRAQEAGLESPLETAPVDVQKTRPEYIRDAESAGLERPLRRAPIAR